MKRLRRFLSRHHGPQPLDWRTDRRCEFMWDDEPPWLRTPRHVRMIQEGYADFRLFLLGMVIGGILALPLLVHTFL